MAFLMWVGLQCFLAVTAYKILVKKYKAMINDLMGSFKKKPFGMLWLFVGIMGIELFAAGILSAEHLSFRILTPFGVIESLALGGLIALTWWVSSLLFGTDS